MGEIWLTTQVNDLRLTAGSGPWNGDDHRFTDKELWECCWLREFYLLPTYNERSHLRHQKIYTHSNGQTSWQMSSVLILDRQIIITKAAGFNKLLYTSPQICNRKKQKFTTYSGNLTSDRNNFAQKFLTGKFINNIHNSNNSDVTVLRALPGSNEEEDQWQPAKYQIDRHDRSAREHECSKVKRIVCAINSKHATVKNTIMHSFC